MGAYLENKIITGNLRILPHWNMRTLTCLLVIRRLTLTGLCLRNCTSYIARENNYIYSISSCRMIGWMNNCLNARLLFFYKPESRYLISSLMSFHHVGCRSQFESFIRLGPRPPFSGYLIQIWNKWTNNLRWICLAIFFTFLGIRFFRVSFTLNLVLTASFSRFIAADNRFLV